MKKIFALLLVTLMVLSLTACMSPSSREPKIQEVTDPATTDEIKVKDYPDTLEGLCDYFADMGYVYAMPEATGDEMTDPVVMKADMIGADKGYKFTYNYDGETVVLELYSYTDTNNDFYKQAKSEGKITVTEALEEGTVDVVLSDNGKYLMIYDDAAENAEREAAIVKAFKGFYA